MVQNEIKTEIIANDGFEQMHKIDEIENSTESPQLKTIDDMIPMIKRPSANAHASDTDTDDKFEFVNSTISTEDVIKPKRLRNHLRLTSTTTTSSSTTGPKYRNIAKKSTPNRMRTFISDAEILKYYDLNCDRCFDYENNEPIKFSTTLENREHYKNVHKMINRCNGVCRVCNLSQTSKSKMREHIQRHENPNQYKCRICDRKFQFSYVLKYHELSHESDEIDTKYYVCDICGLKALTKSGLTKHMGVHQKSSTDDSSSVAKVKKLSPKRVGITCPICNKL